MAEGWHPRFSGMIEGRDVVLEQYEPGGELQVKTTQLADDHTGGSFEPDAKVFPSVINAGDRITIDGADADELERNLIDSGFTERGAREITRLVRI